MRLGERNWRVDRPRTAAGAARQLSYADVGTAMNAATGFASTADKPVKLMGMVPFRQFRVHPDGRWEQFVGHMAPRWKATEPPNVATDINPDFAYAATRVGLWVKVSLSGTVFPIEGLLVSADRGLLLIEQDGQEAPTRVWVSDLYELRVVA